jgi:hypothetical protein
MSKNDLEIDASEVLAMYSELDIKKRKAVYRRATKNALNIVKKQALQNLRGVINPAMMGKKDKWGNSFRTGITTKVYRSGKSGVIHIMKNFKLKFFELGTEDRYRKSGAYTGKISKSEFFSRAKRSKEQEVFNSIDRLISESIKRINDKHKGKK